MPLNKSKKNKTQNTKEKKAIATRLMVISLKFDDYIYKNKPISVQDADAYIEEIKQFKSQCSNDVRSLQVIDKLTLFMKNIVKEITLNVDNVNTNSTNDHNNTQNTYNIPDNTNYDTQNINAVDEKSEVVSNNNVHNNQNILQTRVDERTSTNSLNSAACQNETIDEIAIKLSKENISNDLQVNLSVIAIAQNDSPKLDTQSIFNEKNKVPSECVNKVMVNNNKNSNTALIIDLKKYNKKTKTSKEKNNKKDQNEINKKVEKKTCSEKVKVNKEVKIKKLKKSPQTEVERKNVNKRNKKYKEKPEKIPKIDNFNTNNDLTIERNDEIADLSWVDNIKYVREVSKDEYDTSLNNIEENFWTNSTLPVDWNFNDFDDSD